MNRSFASLIKKEIFSLLISPSSIVSMLLFFLGTAVNFFIIEQFFTMDKGSSDLRFFFSIMPYVSILVIPSLTMNLWSGENDFIESIPFSSLNIILAKFISSSLFFSVSLLSTLIIPLGAHLFADIDNAQLLSGCIVMLICGLSYISLALCISLITKHQASSFLLTSLTLFILNTIHLIPLYIVIPDFISSIIRFISFAWHFDAAGKGILDTRDIFFYLECICIFLLLSVYIREKRKGLVYSAFLVFLYVSAFVLFFIVSSLYYLRIDTTKTKLFSVSPVSEQIISDAQENIQIRYYVSKELDHLYPQVRDIKDFLRAFTLSSKKVSLEIIDPFKENTIDTLSSLGVTSQQIQTVQANTTSFINVYSSIVIEYLNTHEVIPFLLSAASLEFDLVSRIMNQVYNAKKEVYILEGTELSLENDYSYVIPWLEFSGFKIKDFESLNVSLPDPHNPLIVIGSDFTDADVQSIEYFIINGGRALFFISGNTTSIIDWISSPKEPNALRSMLNYWGFSIEDGLLMDISNYRITMQSSEGNSYDYINYPLWVSILPQFVINHPITSSFSGMELYWASPLAVFSTDQSSITVIAQSSGQSFIQSPNSSTLYAENSVYVTDPYILKSMSYNAIEKKSWPVLAVLEGTVPGYYTPMRSSSTKIAVIPDQYSISNMVDYTNSGHNLDLMINILLYLTDEEELLNLKNKADTFYGLYKIQDDAVFTRTKRMVNLTVFVLFPALIVGVPLIILIRRKREL